MVELRLDLECRCVSSVSQTLHSHDGRRSVAGLRQINCRHHFSPLKWVKSAFVLLLLSNRVTPRLLFPRVMWMIVDECGSTWTQVEKDYDHMTEGEKGGIRMNERVVQFDHSGRVTESAQHNIQCHGDNIPCSPRKFYNRISIEWRPV